MSNNDINIGLFSEALNNKADLDLLNLSNAGKARVSNLAMSSNKYIDLTLNASGSTYTAPADGFYLVKKIANSDSSELIRYITLTSLTTAYADSDRGSYGYQLICKIPVCKGDVVQITYTATGTTSIFRFIYSVGSEPIA